MALDPYHLTPTASLNRLRIMGLSALPEHIKGKRAFDLLSAQALAGQVREYADVLLLPSYKSLSDTELIKLLNERLQVMEVQSIHDAALNIASDYANNLLYLVFALKDDIPANRVARPDWDASYWKHWQSVKHIIFTGGLIQGMFGAMVGQYVYRRLLADFKVSFDKSPLTLIGAARSFPSEVVTTPENRALIFDFGGSFVKRAYAIYVESELTDLQLLPSIPSESVGEGETEALLQFMVSTIVECWKEALLHIESDKLIPTIAVSIAAYINEGQPYERQGGAYSYLRDLSDNLELTISRTVSELINHAVQVMLIHDGTAAARAHAGEPNTAVITLGTALGVGFSPPQDGFRPLAHQFKVHAETK